MKRYDIDVEGLCGPGPPYLEITEEYDGDWVKYEDCQRLIDRIAALESYIDCQWRRQNNGE